MWYASIENTAFEWFPRGTRTHMLRQLRLVDYYSHVNPTYHEKYCPSDMKTISEWMLQFDSLQILEYR